MYAQAGPGLFNMFRHILTVPNNSALNRKHTIQHRVGRVSAHLIGYRQIRQQGRTGIVRIQLKQHNRTITVRQRAIRSIRVRRLTIRITSRDLVHFNRQLRGIVLLDFSPLIFDRTYKVGPAFTIQQYSTSKRILRHTSRATR